MNLALKAVEMTLELAGFIGFTIAKLLPTSGAPDMAAMQKLYAAHDSVIVGPPLAVK